MKIRNTLSKLRLSSFQLAIVTGKRFKTKKEEQICKFCDLNDVFNAEIIRTSRKV